jgi:DNA processing protein
MSFNKWDIVGMLERGMRRGEILTPPLASSGVSPPFAKSRVRLISGKGLGSQIGLFDKKTEGNKITQYVGAGVEVVIIGDKNYPEQLEQIADPPIALFYKGDIEILKQKCIAVVGSRDQSERGKREVARIVPELVNPAAHEQRGNLAVREQRGKRFVIVSGLALGTDAQAHRVCLGNNGKTVAVLPCGLDMIYPMRHKDFAEEIVRSGGCLVSEYPFGTEIAKFRFLERNRIISGLSLATLVVEAGKPSGAVATANFAIDQGREVWVVPAKEGDKNSEGILNLIADGAKIV